MVILIDSSSSIGSSSNFGLIQEYVRLLIFGYNLDNVRIALIQFSDTARVKLTLNDNEDIKAMYQTVSNLFFDSTGSNIAAAFEKARTDVFTMAREGVSKAAILITGSVPTINAPDANTEAVLLKDSGVNLVVLGVGSVYSSVQIMGWASDSSKVTEVNNYASLNENVIVVIGYTFPVSTVIPQSGKS